MASRRLRGLQFIELTWGFEAKLLAERILVLVESWQDIVRQARKTADALLMLGCATEELGRLLVKRDCARDLLEYIDDYLLPASVCLKRCVIVRSESDDHIVDSVDYALGPMPQLMHLILVPDKQFATALLEKALKILKLQAEHGSLPN